MRSLLCSILERQACWLGRVLIWSLLLPLACWANDRILEKAYWTDPAGTATFEQARQAEYTPYSGLLSKGFGPQVQWVRLQIDAVPTDTIDTLVLRIRPVFLDSITLYDPVELAQGKHPRITGDTIPFQSTEFESLHPVPFHPAGRPCGPSDCLKSSHAPPL